MCLRTPTPSKKKTAKRTPDGTPQHRAHSLPAEAQERRPAHRRRRGHRHVLQRLLVQRRTRVAVDGLVILGRRSRWQRLRLRLRLLWRRRRGLGVASLRSRSSSYCCSRQPIAAATARQNRPWRMIARRLWSFRASRCPAIQGRRRRRAWGPLPARSRRRAGTGAGPTPVRVARPALEARLSRQRRQQGRRRDGRRAFHFFFFFKTK